ncbi:MAG: SDR family NAD(P)-dependent oxidoreductase [Thermoplasmata archaeon]
MGEGRLQGKVAIVTGAASQGKGVGNGKAISILFAREGAELFLVNRTLSHAQELQEEIEADGGTASSFGADVTRAPAVERMVQAAVERFGRLDILVNNVGGGFPGMGTAVTVEEEGWDKVIALNLKSSMLCSRFSIPRMIDTGGGAIINVSSMAAMAGARIPGSGFTAYAAGKAGLEGLTRAMAADHAREGVRVNSLLVGMVWTPLVSGLGDEVREARRRAVPLRVEGTAWDVAWAAVFLASDEARWITGVSLPVDGGSLVVRRWPGVSEED